MDVGLGSYPFSALGSKARKLGSPGIVSIALVFLNLATGLLLATDLCQRVSVGDGPEFLEVVHLSLDQPSHVISGGQIAEAPSVAALYLVRSVPGSSSVPKMVRLRAV